jgi:outer membrane protein OmpA-like peptidoglycan-associated protein
MQTSPALSIFAVALALAPRTAYAQDAAPVASPPPAPNGAVTTDTPGSAVAPAGTDEPLDEAAWHARDLQLFEQDTLHGGIGLLHTQHAVSGAPGQLRLGFTSEVFSAGFLCSSTYQCPNPTGGPNLTSDTVTHLGGTVTLSATLTRWLEAYAATGAYGNSDNANHPSLLQVLGDTQLGLKVFHPLSKIFHVGGVAELDLVNGSGAVGLLGAGTGGKLRLLGTADLRGRQDPLPLRISLNTTYVIDDTAQVVSAYEAANDAPITRIERFGLEVNRVDHIDVNLGLETFLSQERVRPFLEYSMLIPVNRQGYACVAPNASDDGCLANDLVIPSTLTVGSRFFPWKHGFSLLAAMDIGITGVSSFVQELSPTPPWMLYLGASWAVDTLDRPPTERTQVVTRVIGPKPQGNLRGLVHAKLLQPGDVPKGIVDAIVVFDDHPDLTSRATGPDGRFSVPVDPGSYKLVVHAKGYRDGACGGDMGPKLGDVDVDCPLEPALVQVTATEITIDKQIQFQVDSAIILGESDGLMREIADTLIKNPRIKRVEVQGHTDSSGSDEYNQTLSDQRAVAVRDWLTTHGVAPDRIVAHGYGESRPLIPNVTKGMKALNRRVQFIIMEQTPDQGTAR